MDITLQLAKKNPNFTQLDQHRPMFYNTDVKSGAKTVQEVKQAWVSNLFDANPQDVSATFLEPSFMKASVQVPVKDNELEITKQKSYILIKRDNIEKFYFVDSVKVLNGNTLLFNMTLDVITTYLDKLNFGKYAKIERRHFDRFIKDANGKWIRNMQEDSAIWNNENDLKIKPSKPKEFIPLLFKDDAEKQAVNLYKSHFAHNANTLLIYGMFENSDDEKLVGTGFFNEKGIMPYSKSIVPLFNFNKESDNENTPAFKYLDHDFYDSNSIAERKLLESTKATAFISTILPIEKFWEDKAQGDTPFIRDFKINANITVKSSRVNVTWGANYIFKAVNPVSLIIDPANTKKATPINPVYESKLFTSQFLDINLMDYKLKQKKIINKYIGNNENIEFSFKERFTATEQNTILEIYGNTGLYSDKLNPNNRFVFRDFEQVPSKSSPYANFENNHLQAYKTGLESNRVKTIAGVGAGLTASVISGNPLGAVGAGAGLLSGYYKERQMKAQVEDLKNQAEETKGESSSALLDFDYIANEIYTNSDIPFGLVIYELAKQQKDAINLFLTKYGYETDATEKIATYESLVTRSLFSFWQAPNFANAIDKTNVNNQVVTELNRIFKQGVSLWNVKTDGTVDINNYDNENWELDLYEELQ